MNVSYRESIDPVFPRGMKLAPAGQVVKRLSELVLMLGRHGGGRLLLLSPSLVVHVCVGRSQIEQFGGVH